MNTTTDARYTLNPKQLALLRLLYRFRFATTYHLTIALDLTPTNPNQIQNRLKTLLDQNYIGRNYDGQYRIHGRPAEYFLVEKGISALKQQEIYSCDGRVLHNMYKDKHAKPSTVAHNLDVFTVYCLLKERYGDRLRFFTQSQIYPYKHFPKQKPDALIRLEVEGKQKEFFLEIIDPNSRFFAYVGKIKRYIEYSKDKTWQQTAKTRLPKILWIGDTVGSEIRFQRQAARLLRNHYEMDPKIYTTSMDILKAMFASYDSVWRNVEEREHTVAMQEI